jgi:hypothetical protein
MKRVLVAAALAVVVVPSIVAVTAGRASAGETGPNARRMLVISLPAVSWQDVNDRELPNLNRFLDTAAVADLTTRSVNREIKLGEGYITLGAGTRSVGISSFNESDGNAFEVGERYGADAAGDVYTRRTGRAARNGLVDLDIGDIVDRNEQELFDAEIGALGNALSDAGWSRAVIANGDGLDVENLPGGFYRRQAVTALMGPEGRVPAGAVGATYGTTSPSCWSRRRISCAPTPTGRWPRRCSATDCSMTPCAGPTSSSGDCCKRWISSRTR